jgi:hypothetical protein
VKRMKSTMKVCLFLFASQSSLYYHYCTTADYYYGMTMDIRSFPIAVCTTVNDACSSDQMAFLSLSTVFCRVARSKLETASQN